jgi:hypothetical protein
MSNQICGGYHKLYIECMSSSWSQMLPSSLGVTKDIMYLGPQVPKMEYQEPDDLSIAPKVPSFLQYSVHIANNSVHHTSLVLGGNMSCSME